MNLRFFRFRLRQFVQYLADFPVLYLLLFLLIVFLALGAVYYYIGSLKVAVSTGAVCLLFLLFVHRKRKDYRFIQLIDERPWRVFAVDYLLLSLPLTVILLLKGFWAVALGLVAGCVAVAFAGRPPHRQGRHTPSFPFLPVAAFEVRAGLRRYGLLLAVLYASAYVGLLLPYVSFASLWFCLVVLAEFFRDCESKAILCSAELPSGRFLWRKLAVNLCLLLAAYAPVCITYLLLRPGDAWIVLLFTALSLLNAAVYILSKYGLYMPGGKITSGQIPISLSLLGILAPIFSPVTLLLLVRYARMARRNLNTYLYVYH